MDKKKLEIVALVAVDRFAGGDGMCAGSRGRFAATRSEQGLVKRDERHWIPAFAGMTD
ncbi:hypothetical protein [Herbaspirillum robiniae]|uniref:hypothetical protein n=1 Tax=Herbaspirillum robiniae TaxID=2014887 RepID=UPI0013FDF3E0|nr:hypothetical protein [Herbaspirillum robiniae]